MKVLSLFDGISACHLALTRAGFEIDTYYTSEIDKYATQISESHYPDAIRLGDVTKWEEWDIDWSSIDLVTGGFPCQSWSLAGKQQGDKDERGMLFWTMLDVMKTVLAHNPKANFLMENVKMKKEFEQYITYHTEQALGDVEKILINSALVSAQNRQRWYWTNIQGIEQPEDKGLVLKDVIESGESCAIVKSYGKVPVRTDIDKSHCLQARDYKGFGNQSMTGVLVESSCELRDFVDRDKSYCIDANYSKGGNPQQYFEKSRRQLVFQERPCELREFNHDSLCHHIANATDLSGNQSIKRVYAETGKAPTLTTMGGGHREPKLLTESKLWRKLTPLECERLQTFPDFWTLVTDKNGKQLVSNSQQYKALGNAWTVDVIAHIFSHMKRQTITLEAGLFIPKGTQLSLEFYEQLSEVSVA